MLARISKWGNSLAIRLPKAVAASLQLREGDAADLSIEGNAVLIRPAQPGYKIEELVARMAPEDEPETLNEVNGAPLGREIL